MFELGSAIWRRFVEALEDKQFRRACRRVKARRCSVEEIERRKGARRALLGIHPVYDENRGSVAADMGTLGKELKPHIGVVSTHRRKGHLARGVLPFKGFKEREIESNIPRPPPRDHGLSARDLGVARSAGRYRAELPEPPSLLGVATRDSLYLRQVGR